jgi:hypothetical protein
MNLKLSIINFPIKFSRWIQLIKNWRYSSQNLAEKIPLNSRTQPVQKIAIDFLINKSLF